MLTANKPSALTALILAYPFLLQKGIRRYAIIPVLLNILVFASAWYFLLSPFSSYLELQYMNFSAWLGSFVAILGQVLTALSFIISPLIFITASIFFFYFFSSLTQLIAAPFNAILSEKVEQLLGLPAASAENSQSFMATLRAALPRELYKFYKSVKWLLLMLFLLFIPGLNFLVPLIGAWLLAIDYLDYPADNRGMSFKQSLQLVRQRPVSHLVFGLSIYLACLIPVVNFFVMPAGVCAATVLWHRLNRAQLGAL